MSVGIGSSIDMTTETIIKLFLISFCRGCLPNYLPEDISLD